MLQHQEEINACLERAAQSLAAARELAASGYYDFAASRAYYAAFYAATALLLQTDTTVSKHSGVIALIHQRFVKPGLLDKAQGKSLNWLFELRGVADYGMTLRILPEEAERAIQAAQDFVITARELIQQSSDYENPAADSVPGQ